MESLLYDDVCVCEWVRECVFVKYIKYNIYLFQLKWDFLVFALFGGSISS